MPFIVVHKNTHSGQNKGCLLRLQFLYTAIHIGNIGGSWQGPNWGFFAPAEYTGEERLGFYGQLLPALSGAVGQWPSWYRWLRRATSFRFGLFPSRLLFKHAV